ncbi:hypothetical protein [Desulfovibrio sp. An276]|uniref:hypothetical protein n=1 Tax=Desulfovibrio sp. An276 TaxID=1965618 RepID=UPI001186D01C|nr:hypothetical protein [Desulfovibrio sp. An276]
MDTESLFRKSFQDQAFNALRAKASAILSYVVTFKVIDTDVDNGDAFGTFAISCGSDLVFIPVVMTAGSITSCEMVYLRSEDRFVPLNDNYIKDIVNKNNGSMGEVMTKDVRVEDTRKMFRNLVRPPASSNVVLASNRIDISELPDSAKDKLVGYFNEHPQELAKIAAFYPIDVFSERLSKKAVVEEESTEPIALTTATVTKEAAEKLTDEERTTLLSRGWLIKGAKDETKLVIDPDNFGAELENWISEFNYDKLQTSTGVVCGDVVRFTGGHFEYTPAVVLAKTTSEFPFGATLITDDSSRSDRVKSILLAHEHNPSKGELLDFGFVQIDGLKGQLDKQFKNDCCGRVDIIVPRKHGGWRYLDNIWVEKESTMCVELENGDYRLSNNSHEVFDIVSGITYGALCADGVKTILPKTALFRVSPIKDNAVSGIIPTMQVLFDILRYHGVVLKINRSQGGTSITDSSVQKTASFASDGDAAVWLHDQYNLSDRQIADTLGREKSFVITKLAAGLMQPVQPGLQTPMPVPQPQQPQQILPQGNAQVSVQTFNPGAMEPFIRMQDPDMVDVGILASFAGDPDVRALLVDYLPDFLSVMDRIGRIILLFNIQKTELEKIYRSDKLNELTQNCRRVFKIVGDLVRALKVYINMA